MIKMDKKDVNKVINLIHSAIELTLVEIEVLYQHGRITNPEYVFLKKKLELINTRG